MSDLTAFVGRNDIGKSTVLEALEIFFNNETVKIDSGDACVWSGSKTVEIGCVFSEFPADIVLDSAAKTTLHQEYLLNGDGLLEIRKIFDCALKTPKASVVVVADHPTVEGGSDLISLKITELKKRAEKFGVEKESSDFSNKPSLRQAIWKQLGDLKLESIQVALDSEDAGGIWKKLQESIPSYALFRSDRPSRDDDPEVQDPMKIAIKEAIKTLEPDLKKIKDSVQKQVVEVASRTLEKLKEMDPALAGQLKPNFKAEPKWDGLFSLSLAGDDDIPINKRGSGVRRLILLNFFRAEAERRQIEKGAPDVIYAIEEPETSQHPHNQRMLASALMDLSRRDGCQVILTTHVPGFAGLLPLESLRHVLPKGSSPRIKAPDEQDLSSVASELGVFPDNKVKMLLFVEGPNDVAFLQCVAEKLNSSDPTQVNLRDDARVAFVPVGGSNLREWVEKAFLKEFGRPEFHIYDRDDAKEPRYKVQCDTINAKENGNFATLTSRRELENYLPKAAIERIMEITLPPYDAKEADVPELVAKAIHEASSEVCWEDISSDKKAKKNSNAKRRLNREVIEKLTLAELRAEDTTGEIEGWIQKMTEKLAD